MTARKILVVNTAHDPDLLGGAERSLKELVTGLQRHGNQVRVVCLGSSEGLPSRESEVRRIPSRAFDQLLSHLQVGGVRRMLWHLGEVVRVREYRALRSEIGNFEPDIVHFNNLAGFGWLAWYAARTYPSVQTSRDYSLVCTSATGEHGGHECNRSRLACRLLKTFYQLRVLQPSALVGVSSYVVSRMMANGVVPRLALASVIHNTPTEIARRPEQPIADFGFIGHVTEEKGVGVLLEAFARSNLRGHRRLVLAGPCDPQYEQLLRSRHPELFENGDVRLLGRVDPTEFYSSVSCCVVPTQWEEPFGRVAAEALSAGLPLIYAQKGGLPDVPGIYGGDVIAVHDVSSPDAWTAAFEAASAGQWTRVEGSGVVDSTSAYLNLYETVLAMSP